MTKLKLNRKAKRLEMETHIKAIWDEKDLYTEMV